MSVTKTPIHSNRVNEKGWKIEMTEDGDEVIFENVSVKHNDFSMQVEGLSADEMQVLFSNQETPTIFHQWKTSTAVNPWTQDTAASGKVAYAHMKILRVGGGDGTVISSLRLQ